MLPKINSERPQFKTRGRPPHSRNNTRKSTDSVLDASGRKTGNKRRVISTASKSTNQEETNAKFNDLPNVVMENKISEEENLFIPKKAQVIEELNFLNASMNTVKIQLIKNNNRSFRIQIFLNEQEVRPVSYTGRSSAVAYWNLLKGTLK